jgi:hypothetical protein
VKDPVHVDAVRSVDRVADPAEIVVVLVERQRRSQPDQLRGERQRRRPRLEAGERK